MRQRPTITRNFSHVSVDRAKDADKTQEVYFAVVDLFNLFNPIAPAVTFSPKLFRKTLSSSIGTNMFLAPPATQMSYHSSSSACTELIGVTSGHSDSGMRTLAGESSSACSSESTKL